MSADRSGLVLVRFRSSFCDDLVNETIAPDRKPGIGRSEEWWSGCPLTVVFDCPLSTRISCVTNSQDHGLFIICLGRPMQSVGFVGPCG